MRRCVALMGIVACGIAACGDGGSAGPGPAPDARPPAVDAGHAPVADALPPDAPPPDAAPSGVFQAIDAPSPRTRIVYDGKRQMLYAVDTLDEEIQRYARDATTGVWAAQPAVPVTRLSDIALLPDGDHLVVIDRVRISDVTLDAAPFAVVARANAPVDEACGQFPHLAAPTRAGKVLIATLLGKCSGGSNVLAYDTTTHTVTNVTLMFDATIAGSADGSRVYGGEANLSPDQPIRIFNGDSGTVTPVPVIDNLQTISVSDHATRVLIDGATVYSGAMVALGAVPFELGAAAAVSRDGTRVFVYRQDEPGPRIEIYDLTGALSNGAFPLVHIVSVPVAAPANAGFGVLTLTSTLDDAVVFVSGNRRILVVPVPAH